MKKFICVFVMFALIFPAVILAPGALEAKAISLIKATIPTVAVVAEETEAPDDLEANAAEATQAAAQEVPDSTETMAEEEDAGSLSAEPEEEREEVNQISTPEPDHVEEPVSEAIDPVIPCEEEAEADPDITFTDVSETVYATTAVNVRTGPDVSYEKIDMLYCGESITRTGIGSNGWSKVDHNGQTAYMCSEYLTTDEPAPVEKKMGTTGRLTIPSVGVDVALYYCSCKSAYASQQQAIVDAHDSAAYLDQFNNSFIIADHNNQGFNAMKSSVPYETYAYIDFGSYTQEYVCIGIGIGTNTGTDLLDWDGVSLNYDYIRGGLAMYTCNENSRNITISYWQAV